MSEQQNEELEKKVVTKGPGCVLQAARIEQGISIDDIARQMNLNARILHSLEDDEYTEIQSPIFIRGYLRTYARLVGVDEDNTIKIFGEFYQKNDPDIKSIGNTVPEISSNDFRVKWMTYTVIIGLVALLSVWWVNNYKSVDGIQEQESSESTPIVEEAMEETSILDSNDESSDEMVPDAEINTNEDVSVTTDDVVDVTSEELEIAVEKIESSPSSNEESPNVEIETTTNEQATNDTDIAKEEIAPQIDLVEDTQDRTVLVAEEAIEQVRGSKVFTKEVSAPDGNDILEINVIATSWGEIKDASKFRLIQDLMNSGNSYRLVGKKPFNIFLGNGYGVELALNGKSIDFSEHIKSSNNTARFELEN